MLTIETLRTLMAAWNEWMNVMVLGIMALTLLALWRWRWRDYWLPAKLAKRQAAGQLSDNAGNEMNNAAVTDMVAGQHITVMSVVVTACNQVEQLRQNLPILMGQDFDNYEVIVADEASADGTRELVSQLSEEAERRMAETGCGARLRYTFVPQTARGVDRRKLAITLGIRAARAPWVVLTAADCCPVSDQWLRQMAARCSEDVDIVLGYASYEDDGSRRARRAIYERLRTQMMRYRSAVGTTWLRLPKGRGLRGRAFGGDVANMALRRNWFLEQGGYSADSFGVSLGEGDLLVDCLSRCGRTDIAVGRDAVVNQQLPHAQIVASMRVAARGILRRLSRRGRCYLWREGWASLAAAFFVLALAAYVTVRVAECLQGGWVYDLKSGAEDAMALVFLVAALVIPVCGLRSACDALGCRRFSGCLPLHYALWQPWRTMAIKITYRLRKPGRGDFRRK